MLYCCMNPMNNPRDYVHDFKLKQLYIRHNYIDTNIQNNICKNDVKSFRNFITLLIAFRFSRMSQVFSRFLFFKN